MRGSDYYAMHLWAVEALMLAGGWGVGAGGGSRDILSGVHPDTDRCTWMVLGSRAG